MEDVTKAQELYANDPAYREVADLLYGGGVTFSKMNPDQTSVHVNGKKDRRQRKLTAGLSAVGGAAGAAGLAYTGKDMIHSVKVGRSLKAIKPTTAGVAALEGVGLAGEIMSTKILHNDTKRARVRKDIKDIPETAAFPKRKLTQASFAVTTECAKGVLTKTGATKKLPEKIQTKVKKSVELDIKWEGEISKLNEDKQQVFGWASIVEVNGQPVVDLQGDYISIDEVEKAGYDYVVKSRKGGDMHLRDGDHPVHKSDMIESFIVTPEKKAAMGLPESVPTGWWVGYQVNDADTWALVKNGKRTGFSIHGRGIRTEM
jgi:hypothetical protein